MRTFKDRLLSCSILAASIAVAAGLPTPVLAQSQQRSFDIPAQPLSSALLEFSRQSDVLVVVSPDLTEGKRSRALRASLPVNEAIAQLLRGSNLRAVTNAKGGYRIERIARGRSVAQAAPARETAASMGESSAGSAAADDESAPGQDIVVTGTNIRKSIAPNAPVIQITRQNIERTGYQSTADLLEDLPQNFSEIGRDQGFGPPNRSGLPDQNTENAVAVDLLGLGAESTLVLLNGNRRGGSVNGRTVDISAIPIALIERVDVVIGGRSAIYGSDAVGGVVNFVTRRDYNGAETQVGVSFPTGYKGGEQYRASQIAGIAGPAGSLTAAYEYRKTKALDLLDRGYIQDPLPSGAVPLVQQSVAENRQHSGYLAGRLNLSDQIELFADGIYSNSKAVRTSRDQRTGLVPSFQDTGQANEQYSVNGGMRINTANDWRITVQGNYGVATSDISVVRFTAPSTTTDVEVTRRSAVSAVSALAEGPLFNTDFVAPRLALSAEARRESFDQTGGTFVRTATLNIFSAQPISASRSVDSLAAELSVPFTLSGIGADAHVIELSFAGRYDSYSDFGDTFNPQIGVAWRPTSWFTLRGSFGKAYRAPSLVDLRSTNTAIINRQVDPANGVLTPVLIREGENANLTPETAKSWNVGFDLRPTFLPGVRLSGSYYNVDYTNRIGLPSSTAQRLFVLQNASRYPDLINRTPTAADISQILAETSGSVGNLAGVPFTSTTAGILAAFPSIVIFDARRRNLAVETLEGLTFDIDGRIDLGSSKLILGANVNYVLGHKFRITQTSGDIERLNQPGYPSDFRLRLNAGIDMHGVGLFSYLNYVDGYPNPFTTPASKIGSYTTLDLTFRLDGTQLFENGSLRGASLNVSVDNLFNTRAPLLPPPTGAGTLYDQSNADPFGRTISIQLTKRF